MAREYLLIAWFILLAPTVTYADDSSEINPYRAKLEAVKELLIQEQATGIAAELPSFDETSSASSKSKAKKSRPKGENDPRFPQIIETKPVQFPAFEGGKHACLADLTPRYLDSLSKEQFIALVQRLAEIPIKLLWKDVRGHLRSGKVYWKIFRRKWYDRTTAAAALAIAMGIAHRSDLVTKIILYAPEAVLPGIKDSAGAILTVEVAANTLISFMEQLCPHNTSRLAAAAAQVVRVYTEYWADQDVNEQTLALGNLVLATSKHSIAQLFTSKQKGILLGAILAGSLLHAQKIKSKDEQRIWAVNSISNLIWAASTYLGIIPLVGSATAAMAASLSVAVVMWDVISNKIGIRDFSTRIREVEGYIELTALDSHVERVDILYTLAWMRSTIHVNGLLD